MTSRHALSSVDEVARTATCSECGIVKIYARDNRRTNKSRFRCGKNARERKRKTEITVYGFTKAQRDEFLQGKTCAGCGSAQVFIDHDHLTGDIRGALCRTCNIALGFVKDDVTILRNLIVYLEK